MDKSHCYICKKELTEKEEQLNDIHYVRKFPYHIDKCVICRKNDNK